MLMSIDNDVLQKTYVPHYSDGEILMLQVFSDVGAHRANLKSINNLVTSMVCHQHQDLIIVLPLA